MKVGRKKKKEPVTLKQAYSAVLPEYSTPCLRSPGPSLSPQCPVTIRKLYDPYYPCDGPLVTFNYPGRTCRLFLRIAEKGLWRNLKTMSSHLTSTYQWLWFHTVITNLNYGWDKGKALIYTKSFSKELPEFQPHLQNKVRCPLKRHGAQRFLMVVEVSWHHSRLVQKAPWSPVCPGYGLELRGFKTYIACGLWSQEIYIWDDK